ncbi:MAG TPA: hypothetical protein VGG75_34640 [Trebonia sp.]
MTDTGPFALVVLLAAAAGLAVVLSNRVTERSRIPSPALVLAGAATAVKAVPALHGPSQLLMGRVVTVALVASCSTAGCRLAGPVPGLLPCRSL